MNKGSYIPELADIVWIDFDPQVGREIMKRRPAIVVSPEAYNKQRGLCVVCPISSKIKGDFFEVPLLVKRNAGAIKCDQIKSVDWKIRKIKFIDKASKKILIEVRERIATLLFDDMV